MLINTAMLKYVGGYRAGFAWRASEKRPIFPKSLGSQHLARPLEV